MRYDTATNTFSKNLPFRKDRNQLPGGFSRPDMAAKAGKPPRLPVAQNKGGRKSVFSKDIQKRLPPE